MKTIKEWYKRLDNPIYWSVVHTDTYSIIHMDDVELAESICNDLLLVWEMESLNHKVSFTFVHLTRHVPPSMHPRVKGILDVLLDTGVIVCRDSELRIYNSRDMLQEAMDFAGSWFEGFDPPEDTEIFSFTEKGKQLINELGIDRASMSLAMDFMANSEGNDKLN